MAVTMTRMFFLYTLFSIQIAPSIAQSFNLWNITGSFPNLDSNCISVLNQAVACDPIVGTTKPDEFQTDATLNITCTSSCASSFATYIRRIQGACGTQRYLMSDNSTWLPLLRVERIYEQYQQLCVRNSAGKVCNAVIRDLLSINPDNQVTSSGAAAPAATVQCNECFISSLAQIVQQPYSSNELYSSAFSSLQSSCKTTVTVTSPTSVAWSNTPTPTVSCQGTQYTIKAGDTCQSIALAQGYSTTKLLSANGLVAYCKRFPAAGSSICLPANIKCQPYALKSRDSCQTIASANQASFAQIVAWNPEMGEMCGNIDHLINKTAVVCVSNPGGTWVNPSPVQSSTITSRSDPVFSATVTPMSSLGTQKPAFTLLPNERYVTPVANKTRMDCATYMSPPILINATTRQWSYSCSKIAQAYGVTLDDFLSWNPSINTTGGLIDPCEVSGLNQYCVQVVPQIATDMTSNCNITNVAPSGWTCGTFAQSYNITRAAVVAWNPSVGANCTNYTPGMSYCTAVSHFRSSDTVSSCAYWAMANASSPSICNAMATQYKITTGRFLAWNPSVLSDCSGAVLGYDYCVGTPTVHPGFP